MFLLARDLKNEFSDYTRLLSIVRIMKLRTRRGIPERGNAEDRLSC